MLSDGTKRKLTQTRVYPGKLPVFGLRSSDFLRTSVIRPSAFELETPSGIGCLVWFGAVPVALGLVDLEEVRLVRGTID
jgi:hypothetical protein